MGIYKRKVLGSSRITLLNIVEALSFTVRIFIRHFQFVDLTISDIVTSK